MKTAVLLVAVVAAASCSGGGEPEAGVSSTVQSSVQSTAPAVTGGAPPVTQLSPEAQEELGALEQPVTGGESTGPLGRTVLDLETEDGSVQIGEGDVPDSMSGIPVPDDLSVELSSSTDDAAGFSGLSAQSVDDLVEFYRERLVASGFRLVNEDTPAPSVAVLSFEGESGSGDVALSGAPGGDGTTVIVTFSPVS